LHTFRQLGPKEKQKEGLRSKRSIITKIISLLVSILLMMGTTYTIRGNDFFEKETNIPLLFSFGLGPGGESWLHIGSSHSSMTDFWAGIGIMELRENGQIIERILSRSQFENIKDRLEKIEVNSPISYICDALKYIYVYKGSLNF